MESFRWDSCYVTGLPEVDRQHRNLVDLINRVGRSEKGSGPGTCDEAERTFAELTEYAQYHFTEEEGLMRAAGVDPRHCDHHEREHAHFIEEIARLRSERSADRPSAGDALLRFLTHWLAHHILGQDQSMSRQMAAIAAGQDPAAAYASEEYRFSHATDPLLHALHGLFHEISLRNRELYALNQSLEARVVERTQALLEANQRLETMARTDVLTGLPNRRHAMTVLADEWEATADSGRPLSCLLIDADGFKQINDQFGHDAGDEVLRRLSRAISHAARNDDIVCRLGGDEFLVICPRTPLDGARQLGEKIRAAVADLRVEVAGGLWRGSISVGAAERTPEITSVDDLMKAADRCVYTSKRLGRNRVSIPG